MYEIHVCVKGNTCHRQCASPRVCSPQFNPYRPVFRERVQYGVRHSVSSWMSSCCVTYPSNCLEHLPVTHFYGKEHHDKRRKPDATRPEPKNAGAA
jgi:hypothetical protein